VQSDAAISMLVIQYEGVAGAIKALASDDQTLIILPNKMPDIADMSKVRPEVINAKSSLGSFLRNLVAPP
jgi:hypothetical protein